MGRPIDVYRHAQAPVAVVWSVLTDHEGYRTWARIPTTVLEAEGEEDRNGVGALRRMGVGPFGVKERVVHFAPPRRLSYVIEAGLPVRGYRADVVLTPTSDGGTDIRWTGSFTSVPRGTDRLFRSGFGRVLGELATRLARESERRDGGG